MNWVFSSIFAELNVNPICSQTLWPTTRTIFIINSGDKSKQIGLNVTIRRWTNRQIFNPEECENILFFNSIARFFRLPCLCLTSSGVDSVHTGDNSSIQAIFVGYTSIHLPGTQWRIVDDFYFFADVTETKKVNFVIFPFIGIWHLSLLCIWMWLIFWRTFDVCTVYVTGSAVEFYYIFFSQFYLETHWWNVYHRLRYTTHNKTRHPRWNQTALVQEQTIRRKWKERKKIDDTTSEQMKMESFAILMVRTRTVLTSGSVFHKMSVWGCMYICTLYNVHIGCRAMWRFCFCCSFAFSRDSFLLS